MIDSTKLGRFVEPEIVSTHFHLRDGESVADFGAGGGYFLPILANAVGEEGKVYAFEIQQNLIESLGDLVAKKQLHQVRIVWCDLEEIGGTKLPDEGLDAGLMVNVLFQLEDKEVAAQEINRVLKPGGRLFVIDWTESFGGLGPQTSDVYSEQNARDLFESLGYVFERSFPAGDHHYGLTFRKP